MVFGVARGAVFRRRGVVVFRVDAFAAGAFDGCAGDERPRGCRIPMDVFYGTDKDRRCLELCDGGLIMKLDWKQIIASLVIGLMLGGVLTLRYCPLARHGGWNHSERASKMMLNEFSSKLSLDAGQKEKIAVILEATRAKMDALKKEMRPKFEEIRSATKAEIRNLLTPEQQLKFDQLEAKREAEWQKKRARWSEK